MRFLGFICEIAMPWLAGGVSFYVANRYFAGQQTIELRSIVVDLSRNILNLSTVFVGFIATLLAILFSIRESRLMRKLRKQNVMAISLLRYYIMEPFIINWALLVVSMVGVSYIVYDDCLIRIFFCLLVFLFTLSLCSILRLGVLFMKLFKVPVDE